MRATLLCVLAPLWVVAGQIGRAQAASGEDLLKFVIEQNRSAQEKIQTSSYGVELEWQDDTGKDSPVLKGTGEVKRKGNNLWSIYQRTGLNTTAGKIEQREIRMVVNGKYTASWPRKGNPLAYRNDHSSFETIDPRIETRITLHTPYDFIPYAFGEAVRPFRESVNMDPATKWDAIETKDADGQAVYQIRRFMPTMDDASKPDAVWVVDPRKGFLATDLIAYKQNGDVWIHRSMQIKEVGERIWFPAEYDEKRYGEGREASPAHTVTSWRKAKLKDVKVNEAMAEEQFEIGSLRLREDKADIVVLRTGLDGTTVPYVYSGKGLVPQQV